MRIVSIGVLTACICFAAYAEGADVTDLVAKLKDKDSDLRRAAAKDLSELGAEAKSATPGLTRALRDKDLFVRRYSAEALGNIGPDAKTAIPALAADSGNLVSDPGFESSAGGFIKGEPSSSVARTTSGVLAGAGKFDDEVAPSPDLTQVFRNRGAQADGVQPKAGRQLHRSTSGSRKLFRGIGRDVDGSLRCGAVRLGQLFGGYGETHRRSTPFLSATTPRVSNNSRAVAANCSAS